MATVNKNFRIKDGLIVEGTTGTINGEDILTTGFTTDSLDEGSTNQYYTEDRAKTDAAELLTGASLTNITITGDGNGLTITAENGVADSTTDDLEEGVTNLYFTDQRAIAAVGGSATSDNDPNTVVKRDAFGSFAAGTVDVTQVTVQNAGQIFEDSGLIIQSNSTYPISIQGNQNVEIVSSNGDILLSADGNVYKGSSATAGNEIVTQGRVDQYIGDGTVDGSTGNTVADRISTVAGDLSTHISDTSTHGVTGDIVGTTDYQVLTNKIINDELYFTNPSTTPNDGGIKINDVSEDMEITAYTANLHLKGQVDVTVTANTGDIILNPDGGAYITSVSAGNQIATNSYVDNAVSGLSWKQAVNLLSTSDLTLSADFIGAEIDGHPALTTADAGYRILVNGQEDALENGIYELVLDGGNLIAQRSADADTVAELIGAAVFVMEGTQFGGTSWVQNDHYANSYDDLVWTQFSGGGSITAGTGITVSGLEVSVDRTTVDTWYDEAGAASTHSALTTGVHGVTGDVVGTTDGQELSNKSLRGSTEIHPASGAQPDTGYATIEYIDTDAGNERLKISAEHGWTGGNVGGNLELHAYQDIDITTNNGNIVLNADGNSYLGSVTSGNEIATRGYVDNQTTDDVSEGSTNLYFTDARAVSALEAITPSFVEIDINSVAKQVAAQTNILGSVTGVAISFAKADYRTAKFLVKIDNATHNEVTEVLLTLDSSDNISITEYAIVGTNGSRGTISATVNGANVDLTVTPVNDSEITVVGTLLI